MIIWPCNVVALAVFRRCFTQWYVGGMDGRRTGLRYAVARGIFDALGGKPEDWLDTLEELQVMEAAALEIWRAEAG